MNKLSKSDEMRRLALLKEERRLKKKQPKRWHEQKYKGRRNMYSVRKAEERAKKIFQEGGAKE